MADTVVQISKDEVMKMFGELYMIGFLDTSKFTAENARPTVAAIDTLATNKGLVDDETLYGLITKATERNDAGLVTAELSGYEYKIKEGEIRTTCTLKCNYAMYNKLIAYQEKFTFGEAFLYTKDGYVSYISDETSAYGLPVTMVALDGIPLFSDGANLSTFKLRVNFDGTLFEGIEDKKLAFPIMTLDTVKAV